MFCDACIQGAEDDVVWNCKEGILGIDIELCETCQRRQDNASGREFVIRICAGGGDRDRDVETRTLVGVHGEGGIERSPGFVSYGYEPAQKTRIRR